MKPVIKVRQTLDKAALVHAAVAALDQAVLIGIPEDKNARTTEGAPMTNAVLGYLNEHGSPKNNTPARPSLLPGIRSVQEQTIGFLKAAAKEALRGQTSAVLTNLNKAGLVAVNAVRGMFANNDWTPLKPATLAARARAEGWRGPRRKKGEVATPKRNKPLIFSGQLRKAITYVIRKRGA